MGELEGKDLVIGLSAVFLVWGGGILAASTKLLWDNWRLFARFCEQDREMRLRMSLWLAIPLMMAGLFWMRSVAVWNFLTVASCCSTSVVVQMVIYMPLILASFALILWWIFNRTFDDPATADWLWGGFVLTGMAMGVTSTALSYIY